MKQEETAGRHEATPLDGGALWISSDGLAVIDEPNASAGRYKRSGRPSLGGPDKVRYKVTKSRSWVKAGPEH